MKIPDEAYEAATRAEWNHWGPSWHTLTYETDVEHREYLRSQVERAVEAAAPSIAGQALRDYADELEKLNDGGTNREELVRRSFRVRALRLRADQMETP